MYFVTKLAFVAGMAASISQGAVVSPRTSETPLAPLPDLMRAEHNYGFASVDLDGIYRSYHADGTVVDAARLARAQLETYFAALERFAG
ncbi:uncharacterized protein PG986_012525 [Apiospora aurea]|uniref:Uncharacterized protein n=1 Tax=Apiospora aurea TaxID=335848 RepID=A0ABR1Q084_9PEZI